LTGYVIDTKKPTTSDDAPSGWQNSDVTITLTPSDPDPSSGLAWTRYCTDTTNECDPEGGTDYTGPVTISDEGITYFRYASKDDAGNVQDMVSREIKIDKTAPAVSVLGAPSGWTKETKIASVTCEDQEDLSGCNEDSYGLYISSSEIEVCPSDSSQYTSNDNTSVDSHSWVCAYAEDNAGNGAVSSPVEFKVDKTPPTATLFDDTTDGINALTDWQNTDATIELSCSDTGGSECSDTMYYGLADSADACTPNQEWESTEVLSLEVY